MLQFGTSASNMVSALIQIRWGGKWLHLTYGNFTVLAIFVPKIIKVGGNLTKFWQKKFPYFFGTQCIINNHVIYTVQIRL